MRTSEAAPVSRPASTEPERAADEDVRSTTILASNIHCTTCVNHVTTALEKFGDDVFDVSVRIVSDEISIAHSPGVTAAALARAVSHEAFDVYSVATSDSNGDIIFQCSFDADLEGWFDSRQGRWVPSPLLLPSEAARRLHPLRSATEIRKQASRHSMRKRHVENCHACRTNHAVDVKEPGGQISHEDRVPEKPAASALRLASPFDQPHSYIDTFRPSTPGDAAPSDAAPAQPTPAREPAAPLRAKSPSMEPPAAQGDRRWKLTLSVGGMTCSSCTNAVTDAAKRIGAVETVHVDLLSNSASAEFYGSKEISKQIAEAVEDAGFDVSIAELTSLSSEQPAHPAPTLDGLYRATLSIGGMTCTACSAAITQGLEELSSVKKADIILLTNTGDIVFSGKRNIDKITEKIDDLGYDVTVESLEEASLGPAKSPALIRKIQIKVEGMYCDHCPSRLVGYLSNKYGSSLTLEEAPSMKAPILAITYQPVLPDFTIRTILAAIDSIDPGWKASIYHQPTLEERSKHMQIHERNRILRKLLIAFLTAIPTFIIGVVIMDLLPDSNSLRVYFMEAVWAGNVARADWAMLILATPVYFFAADFFHLKTIKELKALWRPGSKVPILRRFYRFGSMSLLISAGTTVAYISSIAMIIIEATGSARGTSTGSTYFDSVVFLTMFILMGRYLEALSKSKTTDAVSVLGQLRPDKAVLVVPEQDTGSGSNVDVSMYKTETVDAGLLEVGDNVIVPRGSSPPADGIIVGGTSKFDESSLTGESRPVDKGVGEKIFVGTINNGDPVTMEVTGIGGSSMLAQIVAVVREGLSKRAPVERLADIVTGYFVPVISLLAIVTFVIWVSLGYSGALSPSYLGNQAGGWAFWSLGFAISVFVAACPCGIGLAAPTALFVGIGLAAKHSILVRGGGQAFQDAPQLDAIVFDKTGTLTEGGDLKVTEYESLVRDDDEVVAVASTIACRLEEQSTHPIAVAVVSFLADKASSAVTVESTSEVPGRGIKGSFAHTRRDGSQVRYEAAIGSPAFIDALDASLLADGTAAARTMHAWQTQAKSTAMLALRRTAPDAQPWTLAAQFGTSDPIRPSAAPAIRSLQDQGLQVFMLTGDNAATAAAVARAVGIPAANVFAGALPTEKAAKISELARTLRLRSPAPTRRRWLWQRPGPLRDAEKALAEKSSVEEANIAFVGDGINDGPALAAARVSVAAGAGASAAAVAAASFVLVGPGLDAVARLPRLAARVMRRVRLNYAWALVYNALLVPAAAGVFFCTRPGGFVLGPSWAALAMAASSLSVVLSSLALRWEWEWGWGWLRRRSD